MRKFDPERLKLLLHRGESIGAIGSEPSLLFMQARNFVCGVTGVCALARQSGAVVVPVDVGINAQFDEPGIRNEKIRMGTANFSRGPAMTRDQAIASIEAGIRVATSLFAEGYAILGTGEMGIGNTSASSAMLAVLSGIDVANDDKGNVDFVFWHFDTR